MCALCGRTKLRASLSRPSPAVLGSTPTRISFRAIFASLAKYSTQLGLEDLAVIVFGQRVDKTVMPRAFEARDGVEAQPIEFFGRDSRGWAGDDKGDDLLAPFGVRAADDRDFDDVRMAQQHFLDLAWIDVAAAADDHVLGAVAQGQKPFLVKAAQIAGVQPTAAQGFGTGRRVVPIAFHDAVAAGDHLADFAARHLVVTIVDNLDENAGARHPAGTEPVAPARMRLVGVQTHVEAGNRHRRLALAIELVESRPEQLQRAFEIGHVHRTAAIED